jgi:hypothetical protein
MSDFGGSGEGGGTDQPGHAAKRADVTSAGVLPGAGVSGKIAFVDSRGLCAALRAKSSSMAELCTYGNARIRYLTAMFTGRLSTATGNNS